MVDYLAGDLPTVLLDREAFHGALLNLVLNAEQAMPSGGQLVRPHLRHGRRRGPGPDRHRLGMDEATREKVFDAFFSTKRGGSGPGVAHRPQDHRGPRRPRSPCKANGRGTQFTIKLPARPPARRRRRTPVKLCGMRPRGARTAGRHVRVFPCVLTRRHPEGTWSPEHATQQQPISPHDVSGLTTPCSAAKMPYSFTALRQSNTYWTGLETQDERRRQVARWQRVFRYLWRINAVLILIAAGAITYGVGTLLVWQFRASTAQTREAESGPLAGAGVSDPRLFLGEAAMVPGTGFMRRSCSGETRAAASAVAATGDAEHPVHRSW